MFSEGLAILDRYTEKLMWDEMLEELDRKKEQIASLNVELDTTKTELNTAKTELDTAKTDLCTANSKVDILIKTLKANGIDIPDDICDKN